jgi:hypothetical protein
MEGSHFARNFLLTFSQASFVFTTSFALCIIRRAIEIRKVFPMNRGNPDPILKVNLQTFMAK